MNDYDLTYWHKTIEGKKLLAKKIIVGQYKVFNPETGEANKMSKSALMKDYRPDKKNRGVSIRKISNRVRTTKPMSKAFLDYLGRAE
jgi:hypothetical protein